MTAPESLKRSYDALGQEKYSKMLRLIKATWGDDKKAISSAMLSGMQVIIKLYAEDIKEDEFAKRLIKQHPSELVRLGRYHKGSDSIGVSVARHIHKYYNKEFKKHVLPDKFYEVAN